MGFGLIVIREAGAGLSWAFIPSWENGLMSLVDWFETGGFGAGDGVDAGGVRGADEGADVGGPPSFARRFARI